MWIEGWLFKAGSPFPYSLSGLMHSTRYWLVALTTPPAGSAVFTNVLDTMRSWRLPRFHAGRAQQAQGPRSHDSGYQEKKKNGKLLLIRDSIIIYQAKDKGFNATVGCSGSGAWWMKLV